MPGERMCPLGCPVVLWAAHLQAQVFRVSVNMGEQLFASLGGCCRVLGGLLWVEAEKVWGGAGSGLSPGQQEEGGDTHK